MCGTHHFNKSPSEVVQKLHQPLQVRQIKVWPAWPNDGPNPCNGVPVTWGQYGPALTQQPSVKDSDLKFSVGPSAFFLLRAFDRSQDHGLSACRFIKRAEREEQSYCAHYGGS